MTLSYERIGAGRVLTPDETADRRKGVRAFWHRCDFATGTPAARYLAKRGLPWLAQNEAIRFRADTSHPKLPGKLPAMVALVHDGEGSICAAHRTYLADDGSKAGCDPGKASMGSFAGGAVRLHPAGPELLVGEGIETTASAAFLLGLPGWAAVACGNLAQRMILPAGVQSVVIATDPDRAGRRAANKAAQRWRAEGRKVRMAIPDGEGDFNDVLLARLAGAAHA